METKKTFQHLPPDKVACPQCGAVYRVPSDMVHTAGLKARCKKCGASFVINPKRIEDGELKGQAEEGFEFSAHPAEYDTKYRQTPVLQRSVPHGGHDPFAIVIIIICLVAMGFFSYMAYSSLGKGRYFSSLKRLIDNVTKRSLFIPSRRQGRPAIRKPSAQQQYSDLLSAGHKYFRKKQYDRAIKLYSAVLAKKPDNIEALYWRGRAFENKGDRQKALEDYESVITRDPIYAYAYNHIAWIYINSKTWDKAIAYLTKSIQVAPENGWAYYNRGRCYYKLGEQEKALADAKKACELGYKLGCQVYEKYRR